MTDKRLLKFIASVGRTTMVSPYGTDDDDSIEHFVWLLDVPEEDLCQAQDDAILLSFSLYDPDPVPFVIGVADPEKSRFLRSEGEVQTNTAGGKAVLSDRLDQPKATRGQPYWVSSGSLGSLDAPWMPNAMAQSNTLSGAGTFHAH